MPELPEVETVVRDLRKVIVGARFESVTALSDKLLLTPVSRTRRRVRALKGREVESVSRRGKYILIRCTESGSGKQVPGLLLIHLGMTGRLEAGTQLAPLRHVHFQATLAKGRLRFALRLVDPRMFGVVGLLSEAELETYPSIRRMGPEPLTRAFTDAAFASALARHPSLALKAALLDQTTVAGIGNIYADESLFLARLNPTRRASGLTSEESSRLRAAIVSVLRGGVRNRGTSFSDYVDASGKRGRNQFALHAYGRAGLPCTNCGTLLARSVVAGRGTSHCPRCQPLPRLLPLIRID